jgi:hypothetical protein
MDFLNSHKKYGVQESKLRRSRGEIATMIMHMIYFFQVCFFINVLLGIFAPQFPKAL